MARLNLGSYDASPGEGADDTAPSAGDPVRVDDPSYLVGVPDEFQRLWTPHRMVYIQNGAQPTKDDCPFCVAPSLSDEEALIVARGTHAYALLNLFPYNSGHLLVCPYRHIALYDEATPEEVAEIGSLTQTAMRVIRQVSKNDGFNLGMNQGVIAGAGVAAHLHQHVVPRWGGDSNFIAVLAQTKVIPQLLSETRALIAKAWPTQ